MARLLLIMLRQRFRTT